MIRFGNKFDIEDINVRVAIAYLLAIIAFLLIYIAFIK